MDTLQSLEVTMTAFVNGSEASQLNLVGHMIMTTWQGSKSRLHTYYTNSFYIEHTFLGAVK